MKLTRIKVLLELPYLPIWLVPSILLGPMILSGETLFWGTPFLQFVPWRAAAWQILQSGHLPLWNPWVGMGAPLLANYQSALLYPPNWILMALQALGGTAAQAWGQGLVIWMHLIWAGLGMCILVRELGIGKAGQTAAGLAFGMSSYLVARSSFLSINAAAAWVPWVILAANQFAQPNLGFAAIHRVKGFRSSVVGLALPLAMQLLSGHAQTTWYTLIFTGFWVAVWSFRKGGWQALFSAFAKFTLGCTLAAGVAAVQLIPTAEYLVQSQRASAVTFATAVNYSFWPWHLLNLLAPDFFGSPARGDYWFNAWYWEDAVYIGFLPLVTGIIAAISTFIRNNSKESGDPGNDRGIICVFLVIIAVVSLLLAMGRYTPVFPFLYQHVPTFNMFQAPARLSLLAVLALVLLAGYGIEIWQPPQRRSLYWTRLSLAGAVAVMIGAGTAWIAFPNLHATFIRAAAFMGLWAAGAAGLSLLKPRRDAGRNSLWVWGLAILVSGDLLAASWGILPAFPAVLYAQPAGNLGEVTQLLGKGRLYLGKNEEYDLKYIQYYLAKDFNPKMDWNLFKEYLIPNASTLENIPSSNNYDPLIPGEYSYWMEHLDTADPLLKLKLLAKMNVSVIEKIDPYDPGGIRFEHVSGPAEYGWSSCIQTAETDDQAWEILTNKDGIITQNNINPLVISEKISQPVSNDCHRTRVAQISVIRENAMGVDLKVTADAAGWLTQADTWYPGWKAWLDGRQVSIYRSDITFRAVPISAGDHELRIRYVPSTFYTGLAVSLLSLVILIFYQFIKKSS